MLCFALFRVVAVVVVLLFFIWFLQLEVLLRDTHRQEEFAQEEVFNLRDQSVVGLIGSSSSNPTTAIAALAKLAPVNLVLVGFRAASPTLSDQGKYRTFVRVNPTTSDGVRSITSLMQRTFCVNQYAIFYLSSLALTRFCGRASI